MSLDARNDKLMEKKSEQSDNFMFKPHPIMVKHEVEMISEVCGCFVFGVKSILVSFVSLHKSHQIDE
jgi:hypothetical protein